MQKISAIILLYTNIRNSVVCPRSFLFHFSENDDILTNVLKVERDIDYEFLCTGRLQTAD